MYNYFDINKTLQPQIFLTEIEYEKLLNNIDKLQNIAYSYTSNIPYESNLSSFTEAFPNYNKGKILTNESILKEPLLKINNIIIDKPLGEFGEITFNQLAVKILDFIDPILQLREILFIGGLTITDLSYILTFLFMYKKILKLYNLIFKQSNLYKKLFLNLTIRKKIIKKMLWDKSQSRFTFIAIPFIIISLFLSGIIIYNEIKQIIMSFKTSSTLEIDYKNLNLSSENIGFIAFIKKLPYNIGMVVIALSLYSIIKYFLNLYSINIFDPFYLKIFSILAVVVLSFFALDYLFKFILSLYFIKNRNVNISNRLPKLIFNYFNIIKIAVTVDPSYAKFFIYNFFIYFFIIILYFILLYYI